MPDGHADDLPLLILCLPSADAVTASESLARLCARARIVADVAQAEADLAAVAASRVAVLCPVPQAWLALALAAGDPPLRAVQAWCDSVRPLMRLIRARRRQIVLIFNQTFLRDPAGCAAALGMPPPSDAPVAPRAGDDPVLEMIARTALRNDPAAQSMAEELIATALTPAESDSATDPDPDAVFGSYVAMLHQRATAMAAQAEAEAALARVQDETGKLHTALGTAEAALASERARAEAAEASLAESRSKLGTLSTEVDLLRDQTRLDAAALDEMLEALITEQGKAADLEARQAAITARAESGLQAERAARAKAEADRDEMIQHLRAQLHQAGQELENQRVQLERLQNERSDLLVQIAQLRAARADLEGYFDNAKQASEQVGVLSMGLESLQNALQAAQAEAAERAQHVTWLQDEIGRIHRSRSYRLTTPLRKLRSTIGGTNDSM